MGTLHGYSSCSPLTTSALPCCKHWCKRCPWVKARGNSLGKQKAAVGTSFLLSSWTEQQSLPFLPKFPKDKFHLLMNDMEMTEENYFLYIYNIEDAPKQRHLLNKPSKQWLIINIIVNSGQVMATSFAPIPVVQTLYYTLKTLRAICILPFANQTYLT